ncbi:MAG: hypothetical protein AAB464_01820, partial [Patescibacteria group bacterium]
MLKKLKSALKGQALLSAFKAAVFAVLLFLAASHWLFAVILVLASLFFYFSGQSGNFFYSFMILLASSLIIVKFSILNPPAGGQFSILISLVFGALFFILLAIKNLFFINRENYYHFLNNFLFFAVFLIFFQIDKTRFFWLWYLVLFFAVFALFKEPLVQRNYFPSKIDLLAACLAMVIIQYAWALSLLPIGFLNSLVLMTTGALILKDLLANYLNGLLSRRIVLKNITLFVIFSLIVFIA